MPSKGIQMRKARNRKSDGDEEGAEFSIQMKGPRGSILRAISGGVKSHWSDQADSGGGRTLDGRPDVRFSPRANKKTPRPVKRRSKAKPRARRRTRTSISRPTSPLEAIEEVSDDAESGYHVGVSNWDATWGRNGGTSAEAALSQTPLPERRKHMVAQITVDGQNFAIPLDQVESMRDDFDDPKQPKCAKHNIVHNAIMRPQSFKLSSFVASSSLARSPKDYPGQHGAKMPSSRRPRKGRRRTRLGSRRREQGTPEPTNASEAQSNARAKPGANKRLSPQLRIVPTTESCDPRSESPHEKRYREFGESIEKGTASSLSFGFDADTFDEDEDQDNIQHT